LLKPLATADESAGPPNLSDEALLAKLLELNHARASPAK
jgi:hypothetical protein